MKQFIITYKGPATAPDASHEGWPEWFDGIGDALINKGAPFVSGTSIKSGGTTIPSTLNLNGYSIIQAETREAVHQLVKSHPYLALGEAYAIEVFELPS